MEFLNNFDMNKKYVFDREIYIEYMLNLDEYSGDDKAEEYWINACNNKFVTLKDSQNGFISTNNNALGDYKVIPQWCREVPSIRLLQADEL